MGNNLLLILADDLNAWIGALGRNPDVRTPHIDALAERGTLFTHAYCAAPYCHSSRMAMFTGRTPATSGIYHQEEHDWEDPARAPTFMELLHDAGWRTFGAGKVFHGSFNYRSAFRDGATRARWRKDRGNRAPLWDDFARNRHDPLPRDWPRNGPYDLHDESLLPSHFTFDWAPVGEAMEARLPDRLVTDAVVSFLSGTPTEPFFCAAGLYKPHLPWYVPARYFQRYPRRALSMPLVKVDDLDDVPPRARLLAEAVGEHPALMAKNQWRSAVRGYLAAISYCDDLVGELVGALDRAGLADRTTVVLAGDNGFHLGEKLHWRKLTLWEEATRVPLVVCEPGRPAGNRVHDPVSLVDTFPTLLELSGLESPAAHDGLSLVPLLDGPGPEASLEAPAAPARRPALSTWLPGNHSLRTADWRYIRYVDGTEELYDHRSDPYEWTNLAGRPRYRTLMDRLAAGLPDDREAADAYLAEVRRAMAEREARGEPMGSRWPAWDPTLAATEDGSDEGLDDGDPDEGDPDDVEPDDVEPDDVEPDDVEPDDVEREDGAPGDAAPGDVGPGDGDDRDAIEESEPAGG